MRVSGWVLSVSLCGLVGCGPVTPTGAAGGGSAGGGSTVDDAGLDAGLDAGGVDASVFDAGLDAGADAGPPDAGLADAGSGTVLYPFDRTHSPVSPEVAARWRARVQGFATQPRVFAKVGDSNTVNTNHLACFAKAGVNLGAHAELQSTLDFFKGGQAGAATPFDRVSLAATVGWSANAPLQGTPSPLAQELAAITPRLATVMFGTNDIQSMNPESYARNLLAIVDALLAKGALPLVSSVPPRDDSPAADLVVPRYNALARAVAQARGVPFVDLHRELLGLPAHGIGGDGLHLNAAPGPQACALTTAGLQYGHNRRNLVVLQALHRLRLGLDGTASDASAPRLQGQGSVESPFRVPSLPFVHFGDTRTQGSNRLSSYPSCSPADESGPELYYRLELAKPTKLRALVVSLAGADLDVHLLQGAFSGSDCVTRADATLTAPSAMGPMLLSVDTYASGGVDRRGEYLLVVLEDP